MTVRIQTADSGLIKRLLLTDLDAEKRIPIGEGCYLVPETPYEESHRMAAIPRILEFAVTAARDVGFGVLASWLYELMRNQRVEVEVGGIRLRGSKKEVQEIVEKITRQ
jgi:hypothetical protein